MLFSVLCAIFSALLQVSEAHWGSNNGEWGGGVGWGGQPGLGFHSGYNRHQGNGYGSDICAGARQRQGIGTTFQHHQQQQPVSPYSYNGESGGYYNNNGQYQLAPMQQRPIHQQYYEPSGMTMPIPIQNSNLDYRINIPTVITTTAPAVALCSLPPIRDSEVFSQKCIFPPNSLENSCSSQGRELSTGTISLTSCKAPEYYSDTGDMILEVCKDGRWHSNGKTLTCKSSTTIATPAPKPSVVQNNMQQPQIVEQLISNNNDNNKPNSIIDSSNNQNKQAQPAVSPPLRQQEESKIQEPKRVENPQNSPYYYWMHNTSKTQMTPPHQQANPYYPPFEPSSTTTTTEPTTPITTTTTTTEKPMRIFDNIDWRLYSGTNARPAPSSSPEIYNQGYEKTKNQTQASNNFGGQCPPLVSKAGVILECLLKSAQSGGSGYILSVNDCQKSQPLDTEATYKCQMYYEPLTGLPTQYRKCKEPGVWTGNEDGFGCKLECGISNPGGRLPLITFGQATASSQFPFHAAVFLKDRGVDANACGGTLISRKAIITAGHCVNLYLSSVARDLSDIRVDLGRYHREKDDPYVQKFNVEKIVTHPAYNPYIFESDIAVIILKESAKIGYHVRPVCMSQNAAFNEMQLADGSYATVVGWGVDETGESPDELRSAKIQVVGYRECIESFEEADTGALLAKSTTFCAGNKNGTNVCRGDSGSGAFFGVKTASGSTKWYLQGIVSLGINVSADDKKCDPEKISIFTRVGPYADWINRVLSDNDAM